MVASTSRRENIPPDLETLNLYVQQCALPSPAADERVTAYIAWQKNKPICPTIYAVMKDSESGESELMVLVNTNDIVEVVLASELVRALADAREGVIKVNPAYVQSPEVVEAVLRMAGPQRGEPGAGRRKSN